MKLWSVFVKSMREQVRDIWTLSLTLSLAPAFVLMYWLFFGGGSTQYDVLVLNQDTGATLAGGAAWNAGEAVIDTLGTAIAYEDGLPMLEIEQVTDRDEAEQRIEDREANLLLIIPADFSQALAAGQPEAANLTVVGDLTNTYYSVTAVLAGAGLDSFLAEQGMGTGGFTVTEEVLGGSEARTEFELYVPGLLIFAVLMIIYQTAMVIAHEVEAGTLLRLRISRLAAWELLGGISLTQVLIGTAAVLLAFLTALALGFESQGPLPAAILVGAATSLSMVGVGLVVACFVRTVTQAFMVASFPLFFMMFFSGVFLPVPPLTVATIGGHAIDLFDILPPKHAVTALNKVLSLGAGLDDIVFELVAVLALSFLYFAAGIGLFQRMHLRRA